jgi:hypothetical protein
VLDRRLHHVSERQGAEPPQRLAPRFQRARRRHGFGADEAFVADRVEHVGRCAGDRPIAVGLAGKRNGTLAVDDAVATVGETHMCHAAADDADHHRLDDRQCEQRRNRRIDGVATRGEHFSARG